MANSWHVKWLAEGVVKWNKRRKKVAFSPDLSGIRFFDLLPPDFRDSPKTSRFFEKIDLSGSNISGSDLSGMNFQGANFRNSILVEANMSMSNFQKAKFERCDMTGAIITRSFFDGARFDSTNLSSVDFSEVVSLNAQFIGIRLDAIQKMQVIAAGGMEFESRAELRDFMRASAPDQAYVEVTPPKMSRELKGNRIDVFFGTNREPIIRQGKIVDYSSDRAEALSFGN